MRLLMSEESPRTFTVKEFLEDVAPGSPVIVSGLTPELYFSQGSGYGHFSAPELLLHCDNDQCAGPRLYAASGITQLALKRVTEAFVLYICKNCTSSKKTFAIRFVLDKDKSGLAFKFGEQPAFGPPTPARLIALIGPDRELFLKVRRAENQGLGIGAFAYYRRVVEQQKNRIFDEVIKACARLSAGEETLDELKAAKGETQFKTAVDCLKHGLPKALFINAQNPLLLLHGALSEGLHAESDEDCLQWATVIRVVMSAFAERMSQVLKDEAELNAAVTKLIQKRAKACPSGRPALALDSLSSSTAGEHAASMTSSAASG